MMVMKYIVMRATCKDLMFILYRDAWVYIYLLYVNDMENPYEHINVYIYYIYIDYDICVIVEERHTRINICINIFPFRTTTSTFSSWFHD